VIKIENTEVYGWEAAIRGMRNPMNSWDKSDTVLSVSYSAEDRWVYYAIVGENDLGLMKKLVAAGTDHSKFMRMINVTCDVVAPLYWWKEADTYKVGTVRDSCSTMHTIQAKEFTLDDFSHENLLDSAIEGVLWYTINALNTAREMYLRPNCTCKKEAWWQMIQLLPSSYNQRATLQLNYAVLRNMYHSRKNHKLDEWRDFCKWIEKLPYSELITGMETAENTV
jgi:hypothetical protein